jgi:hypothetical protein
VVAFDVRARSSGNAGLQPLRAKVPLLLGWRAAEPGPAQSGRGAGPAEPEAELRLAIHTGWEVNLARSSSTKVCGGPEGLACDGAAAERGLPVPVTAGGLSPSTSLFRAGLFPARLFLRPVAASASGGSGFVLSAGSERAAPGFPRPLPLSPLPLSLPFSPAFLSGSFGFLWTAPQQARDSSRF